MKQNSFSEGKSPLFSFEQFQFKTYENGRKNRHAQIMEGK